MRKIIAIVLVVLLLNALLWWVLRIRSRDASPADSAPVVAERVEPVAAAEPVAETLPEPIPVDPVVETPPPVREAEVPSEQKPWLPYVGTWAGSIVCHDITYREGEPLECSVQLVVGEDGMCSLQTSRKFKSDGLVHGQFSDKAMWPGDSFDERDGRFYFESPESGFVQAAWLSTREQMVEIEIRRAQEKK